MCVCREYCFRAEPRAYFELLGTVFFRAIIGSGIGVLVSFSCICYCIALAESFLPSCIAIRVIESTGSISAAEWCLCPRGASTHWRCDRNDDFEVFAQVFASALTLTIFGWIG